MAKLKATASKIEKRITSTDNKQLGVINFDFDNKYPQRVIDIVNESGTAKTCIRLFSKFVMGGGAKDKDFYKSVINPKGLTIDKLIRKQADSLGWFGSFALHVNYTGLGHTADVYFIPYEFCRLVPEDDKKHPGKIAVYNDWGLLKSKTIKESDVKFIDLFDPNNALRQAEQAGGLEHYSGQIYYYSPSGMEQYSLVPYDAVLEDMQTESQVKKFKNSTASKNFLASHILVTGATEEGTEGEKEAEKFVENLKDFQGGDNAGTILWLERENTAELIDLKKVDIQSYDGLYEYTENSSRDSIIKQFLIPPVLILQSAGGLGGSGTEMAIATEYYSDVTYDYRLIIEEALTEIFSIFEKPICPSGDFSILPLKYRKPIEQAYFPYYSENEIRISNGDEAKQDLLSVTTPLAVTLGVGGTVALTTIIADMTLSVEQKKGTLMVLFNLTDEQTNQMLGIV